MLLTPSLVYYVTDPFVTLVFIDCFSCLHFFQPLQSGSIFLTRFLYLPSFREARLNRPLYYNAGRVLHGTACRDLLRMSVAITTMCTRLYRLTFLYQTCYFPFTSVRGCTCVCMCTYMYLCVPVSRVFGFWWQCGLWNLKKYDFKNKNQQNLDM